MSEKEKQLFIQKVIKICVATISLIILIISFWIIFDCFKTSPDRQNLIVNYNSNASADYKVYLKPNKFYDKQFLGKDKKYISSIINYIDIDVNYMFNTSKAVSTQYDYSVTAKISSDYEVNSQVYELWGKDYVIKPKETKELSKASSFKISENIKIDYSKYDALAKSFKEAYGVMADTKLTVSVNINSSSKLSGYDKNIAENKSINIVIPLNKSVTDISVSGVGNNNQNITETVKGKKNVNYVLLVLSIAMAAVFGPLCAITFYKLFKITNVSQYIVQQKRILKSYGDIIAEVTTKPDLHDLKIVEVKDFENLINIEEELRIPILFYELEKEDESWFIITTETQAYRYILKSTTHLMIK